MIEAHVQFNGVNFQGYRERQPGMTCEFEDHRTCKALSEKLQAEEDAKSQAEKDAAEVERRQKIDAETKRQIEDAAQAEINAAAKAKGEALRVVNLAWKETRENLDAKLSEELAEIEREAQDKKARAEEAHRALSEKSDQIRADELAKVEAEDWMAKTKAPQEPAQ